MDGQKQTQLLPVYLILGEDELKRETVLKRLHTRLNSMGDLTFNSEVFSAPNCAGADIVSAANTLPFASSVRLVEVHDVEKFKKADSEAIIVYLQQPCSTTILALVAQKLAKNSRLYKAVEKFDKSAIIDCTPFKRKEMGNVVRSMAVSHGITCTPAAAATLIDLVGTNTVALDSELKKIALSHRGTDPVNENEILSLVARTAEVQPWELIDAFSGRNAQRCMYLLHRMKSTSSYGLLPMCVTRIRELISVKALIARGEEQTVALRLKLPEWRVKNLRQWAHGFSMKELCEALKTARDTEQKMKSGTDPDDAFISWMLNVCQKQ